METSIDSKDGTMQMDKSFWRTILKKYEESKTAKLYSHKRTSNTCRSRWGRIQKGVNCWLGCYEEAVRRNQGKSGHNGEADIIKDAHLVHSKPFKFDHCWRSMRKYAKWEVHLNKPLPGVVSKSQGKGKGKGKGKGSQAENVEAETVQISTESSGSGKRSWAQVDLDEELEATPTSRQSKRPMGNKAAKNLSKRKNIAFGSLDNLVGSLDELSTRSDRELEIQEKKIETERLKAEAKIETQRMKREMQDRKMKFEMLMQLNSKPQLDEFDQQMKMMLMRELGFTDV